MIRTSSFFHRREMCSLPHRSSKSSSFFPMIILIAMAMITVVIQAQSAVVFTAREPNEGLYPKFKYEFAGDFFPVNIQVKIAVPSTHARLFASTLKPRLIECWLSSESVNKYLTLPVPQIHQTNFGTPDDNVNHFSWPFSFVSPLTSSAVFHTFQCTYHIPYPLPMRLMHSEVVDRLWLGGGNNIDTNNKLASLFHLSFTQKTATTGLLHINNMLPYAQDFNLLKTLSFIISEGTTEVSSSGVSVPSDGTTFYLANGSVQQSTTANSPRLDTALITFPNSIPSNTILMTISITFSEQLPAGIGVEINNLTGSNYVAMKSLLIVPTTVFPGPFISLKQPIEESTTAVEPSYKTRQQKDYVMIFVINKLADRNHIFMIEPSMMFTNHLFITQCTVSSNLRSPIITSSTTNFSTKITFSLPSTHQDPFEIKCHMTLTPWGATLSPLAGFNEAFSGIRASIGLETAPFFTTHLQSPLMTTTEPLPALSTLTKPFKARMVPKQYYVQGSPTIEVVLLLENLGVMTQFPRLSFHYDSLAYSASIGAIDHVSTQSLRWGYNTDGSVATKTVTPGSPTQVQLLNNVKHFGYPVRNTAERLAHPMLQYSITFTLNTPATLSHNSDFLMLPASNTVDPSFKVVLEYDSLILEDVVKFAPVGILPTPTAQLQNPQLPLFALSRSLAYHDVPLDLFLSYNPFIQHIGSIESYPTNSLWRTQNKGEVHSFTTFQWTFRCNNCNFGRTTTIRAGEWRLSGTTGPSNVANEYKIGCSWDLDDYPTNPAAFPLQASFQVYPLGTVFSISGQVEMATLANGPLITIASHTKPWVVMSLEANMEDYGTSINNIASPSDTVSIPRLIDNDNVQLTTKPVISTSNTKTFQLSFTPSSTGFEQQSVSLWFMNSATGHEQFIADIVTNTPSTLTDYPIPSAKRLYNNAFLKFSYVSPAAAGTQALATSNSVYFDLIPGCMKLAKAQNQNELTLDLLATDCPSTNDICIMSLGECRPVTYIDPLGPDHDCAQCEDSNTSRCDGQRNDGTDICECRDGWLGLTCHQSSQCNSPSHSKPRCNLINGYIDITPSGQCATSCTCYNKWSGLSCQTCELQCLNGGIAYNTCAKCGCAQGYAGPNCSCSAVTAKLTLFATNSDIIMTGGFFNGKLMEVNKDLLSLYGSSTTGFTLPKSITQQEIELYSMIDEIYHSLRYSLTSNNNGHFTMSIKPNSKYKTEFSFDILFNCESENPHITSLDNLKTLWSSFTTTFHTNAAITKYFTFGSDDVSVIPTELTPVIETLPPEDQQLKNNTNAHLLSPLVMIFITLLYTLMVH